MRLKELSMKKAMNIIYVSRLNIIEENDVETYVPSLELKWLNIVNGNSDYTILCRKIGKNYIRRVESKRKNYTRDKVDDGRIASLLDTVIGAYEKSKSTSTAKAKEIVKEQDKQQEAERRIRQGERQQSPDARSTDAKSTDEKSTDDKSADEKDESPSESGSVDQEKATRRPPRLNPKTQ